MRRLLAALVLVLLLAPEAWAQTGGEHERTLPTQAEIAAQASLPTSYLLSLYMMQLASAGTPPSQSDIDDATRQYFTNGAAMTSVPTGGPGADYFRNGAAVTGVPSSGPGAAYFQNGAKVLAYYPPPVAPVEKPAGEVVAGPVASASAAPAIPAVEDAGVQSPPAATEAASAVAPMPWPSAWGCPTCATPEQIEAALANASRRETSPPPAQTANAEPAPAPSTGVSPATEPVSPSATGPAVNCPSGPSPLSRIGTVLGGALLGGLVVVLWSRPRSLRVQPHH